MITNTQLKVLEKRIAKNRLTSFNKSDIKSKAEITENNAENIISFWEFHEEEQKTSKTDKSEFINGFLSMDNYPLTNNFYDWNLGKTEFHNEFSKKLCKYQSSDLPQIIKTGKRGEEYKYFLKSKIARIKSENDANMILSDLKLSSARKKGVFGLIFKTVKIVEVVRYGFITEINEEYNYITIDSFESKDASDLQTFSYSLNSFKEIINELSIYDLIKLEIDMTPNEDNYIGIRPIIPNEFDKDFINDVLLSINYKIDEGYIS